MVLSLEGDPARTRKKYNIKGAFPSSTTIY